MSLKFFSHSFGCRVNQAEKEEIDSQLITCGFKLDKISPDFYIINTCCVTHKAEREAKQFIRRLKKELPKTKIIVTGCAATYWQKNNVDKQIPADLLVNNLNKKFLVKMIINRFLNRFSNRFQKYFFGETKNKYLNSKRLLIKIQNGCHRFCSYCIVPYLRGLPQSKRIAEVLMEIKRFPNIKEVILTAINTEDYGKDTGETLIQLLKSIIRKTKIPRVSFGSIHPFTIDDKFLTFYQEVLPIGRLVNFFHIPVQSGSNKILNLMRRQYTKEEIIERIFAINRLNNKALIGTDIIVGFLNEEEKDFEETYHFLERSPIAKFHIFRFSKRKDTIAYFMAKKMEEPNELLKQKRAKILLELGKKKYNQFLQSLLNWKTTALFINKVNDNYQQALLENQIPVFIKTEKNLTGEIKNVKIIEFKKKKLFGKII